MASGSGATGGSGGSRHLGKTGELAKNSLHGNMDCEFPDTALSGDEEDGDDDGSSSGAGGGGVGSSGAGGGDSGEGEARDGLRQVCIMSGM